jgi:Uma2 family endonuclease
MLPDKNRYEILNGKLYTMTPSPSTKHQIVSGKLYLHLANYFANKDCFVFYSPYDVLLPEGNEEVQNIKTVVQPDLLVVCDKSKICEKHCLGSPDFIIEIASPSSPSIDYIKKLHLYEKHKIKEYWIVNYVRKEIVVYSLQENDEYGEFEIYKNGQICSSIFTDLTINLKDIFIY